MSEMIERVAKAIELRDTTDALAMARAAIAAMRDPTEKMWNAPAKSGCCVNGVLPTGEEAEAMWQSMIDEALK